MGIILVDKEHTCMCDNQTKCILKEKRESGSVERCTRKELEKEGYTAWTWPEIKENRAWLFGKKRPRIFREKRN